MIFTYVLRTFWSFHPRFSTILRPFGVPTHVETIVCITYRKKDKENDSLLFEQSHHQR